MVHSELFEQAHQCRVLLIRCLVQDELYIGTSLYDLNAFFRSRIDVPSRFLIGLSESSFVDLVVLGMAFLRHEDHLACPAVVLRRPGSSEASPPSFIDFEPSSIPQ